MSKKSDSNVKFPKWLVWVLALGLAAVIYFFTAGRHPPQLDVELEGDQPLFAVATEGAAPPQEENEEDPQQMDVLPDSSPDAIDKPVGSADAVPTEPTPAPLQEQVSPPQDNVNAGLTPSLSLQDIPPYSGSPYTAISANVPFFSANELVPSSFEVYMPLDDLGRCGAAYASVGQDLMPTEERQDIDEVTPSGWNQAEYPNVDGGWLYNRCHLIGYQLSGQNANPENLITGTRYLNVEGMLPFENLVADYVRETGNHVLYRVTPLFEGDELVCRGVEMEAQSVEDGGAGVMYHVFCYNVQPGIEIIYTDGASAEQNTPGDVLPEETPVQHTPGLPQQSDIVLPAVRTQALMGLPPSRRAK